MPEERSRGGVALVSLEASAGRWVSKQEDANESTRGHRHEPLSELREAEVT